MIAFDDTEIAFRDKSDGQLRLMHFLFSTMNYPAITNFGIWSTITALRLKLPVKGMIRKTIFAQFCGGESLQGCSQTIEELGKANIKAILDFSAEGEKTEEGFEQNKQEILRSLEFSEGNKHIPIGVMKLTGFVSFGLLVKIQAGDKLSVSEQQAYDRFEARVEEICASAVAKRKHMFIDAEESWIQDVIDRVAIKMMLKFNKEKPYIFNTYQLYRTSALDSLKAHHNQLSEKGYFFGAKLVRGAYMEKERERAEELGYPDPIQPNKQSCDNDYNEAVKYCFDHVENCAVCVGTHNEKSCAYLADLIEKSIIDRNDWRVYFAQLYGMSDNISYKLSDQGYNVAKYVPYGPVEKVLPYLMRRAEENTAIAGQTSREFSLVKKEIRRRKSLK